MIRLINPRGRIIDLTEEEKDKIPLLLKQGFVFPPEDQKNVSYSHVFDRGDAATERKPVRNVQRMKVESVGDTLQAQEI